MKISKPAPETGIDDTSSIDANIDNLSTRYIQPIDKLRSISRPGLSPGVGNSNSSAIPIIKSDFSSLQINNAKPLESRAHTFYRMLGFPVATDSGFYNPGFDPAATSTFTSRQSINSKIPQALQSVMNQRETDVDTRVQVFKNQDVSSSVYAILLRYPLPFNVLTSGVQPLDVDKQFFTVDDRKSAAAYIAKINSSLGSNITSAAGNFFGARHILKPFIVDPRIENTVMPDTNKICVPFLLDKKATKIAENSYCQRPGIELIIRQRLSDSVVDTEFLNQLSNVISGTVTSGVNQGTLTSSGLIAANGLDRGTIVDTIEALTGSNNIDSSVTDTFTNFTNTQINTVATLVETIKAVIGELAKAMLTIDRASQQINWFPIPGSSGPGTGAVGASLSRSGTSSAMSVLDNNIVELRIKKLNAQIQINSQPDLGDFASPFAGSSGSDSIAVFDNQLQQLVQKRDKIAQDALIAMGNIETITGEISGLGLVNILAIYTALWAIDIGSLINFLDNNSFQRMITNNPTFLNVSEVSSRKNGTTISITKVLSTFESLLSNILSFADTLLSNQLLSPSEFTNGSVV